MYRTNYIMYDKDGITTEFVSKACFGGLRAAVKNKITLQLFVLNEYKDRYNNFNTSDNDVKLLIRDLNSVGFEIDYFKTNNIKRFYKKEENSSHVFKYKLGESNFSGHVFEFSIKKYGNVNALLFALTVIRYLYENPLQNILVEYFKIRKDKKGKRLGIIRALQIAHYTGVNAISFGGHCVGYLHTEHKMVKNKEIKYRINTKTNSAQLMFKGKLRKNPIHIRKRLLSGMNFNEVLKRIK